MSSMRAGTYQKQLGGYSAFMPTPLPPNPPVKIDDEMQSLLSQADRALGRLDGSIQALPDPDLFVLMYVKKEAVLSSQIEGTQSSLNDLLRAEAEIFDPDRPADVGEVSNYISAMNHGLKRLKELPLSIRLVREIHEKLLTGIRGPNLQPGELRRSQNWIGPPGSTTRDATYVPPPHHEVPQLLGDLEKFGHSSDALPALIKIGLIHAQFETIHPFLDGNGRTGRLLITFLLCQQGILARPVLYLSHYLKRYRQNYYDLLQGVRNNGEWEAWLKFFLKGIRQVAQEAANTARAIVGLRETSWKLIVDNLGHTAGNALRVHESLFRSPFTSVNKIAGQLGVSFPAANRLVGRMVDIGVLVEARGYARNRAFSYPAYIKLFADS